MEDTLGIGDRVLVNRVVYPPARHRARRRRVFDGSDSFAYPGRWSAPVYPVDRRARVSAGQSIGLVPPDSTDFIKRVIGVGGDRVVCCDTEGRMTVNGVPVEEASYLYPDDAPSTQTFDVVVPQGMLWVMGDHRSNSADSRAHMGDPGGGFVPESKVVGRAMAVLWPISRLQSIEIPETFATVPAPESGS